MGKNRMIHTYTTKKKLSVRYTIMSAHIELEGEKLRV